MAGPVPETAGCPDRDGESCDHGSWTGSGAAEYSLCLKGSDRGVLPEQHPRCDWPPNDANLFKEEDAKSDSCEERTIANGSKRYKIRISQ